MFRVENPSYNLTPIWLISTSKLTEFGNIFVVLQKSLLFVHPCTTRNNFFARLDLSRNQYV